MFNIFCTMDEKEKSTIQRCLFAAMLGVLFSEGGEADSLLDGRTLEERLQMAKAWDAYQHTPVGKILKRPDFENLKT